MASLLVSLLQVVLVVLTCIFDAATVVKSTPHHDRTLETFSSTNSSNNHHWIGPIGHRKITVDINGGARFRSVQDAVNAVPDNNTNNVIIQISAGCYMYIIIILLLEQITRFRVIICTHFFYFYIYTKFSHYSNIIQLLRYPLSVYYICVITQNFNESQHYLLFLLLFLFDKAH